jgi:hypothetical protein
MTKATRVHSTPPTNTSKIQSKPPVIKQAKPRDHEAEDRKAAKAHPDYKLIKACVEYGFLFGGTGSGFAIDPTDSHFAGPVDSRNCERAEEIITAGEQIQTGYIGRSVGKGRRGKDDLWRRKLYQRLRTGLPANPR